MNPAVGVEVLFLRLEHGDRLAYRRTGATVAGGSSPHQVALALCGGPSGADLLHSTSWRHDAEHGLVLTYAAVPDPEPTAAAVPLTDPSIVSSGDAVRPQPELLHMHHVVAHAVRHLAELAWRDPTVAEAAHHGDPALWRRISEVAATTPTATHDETHQLARQQTHPPHRAEDTLEPGAVGGSAGA